jgi:hypothetical protein
MTTYETTANDMIKNYGKEKSIYKVYQFFIDARKSGDKELSDFWDKILTIIKEK